MSKAKLAPEIAALVEGPRLPGGLTWAEYELLLTLRQQGYDLVSDWCQGPRGGYYHKRVIRKAKSA